MWPYYHFKTWKYALKIIQLTESNLFLLPRLSVISSSKTTEALIPPIIVWSHWMDLDDTFKAGYCLITLYSYSQMQCWAIFISSTALKATTMTQWLQRTSETQRSKQDKIPCQFASSESVTGHTEGRKNKRLCFVFHLSFTNRATNKVTHLSYFLPFWLA